LAGENFGEFTHFEQLAKIIWRMNRFSQKFIIVSGNFDVLVWQIIDDLPNFLPAKRSHYTVAIITLTYVYSLAT